ncbi:hypothetical protein PTT_09976 [Pyrenophora teres f. teres 0-1]|uniref:Uncharacterized protein n=1 Tax=Pyrenophora teres f. teres (strain 0-1) TaxID=861557 RepID=E3RN60_PYRTT|nr:hypothetical protein PTT_09976 [Pyrenophora teres f. teres 0-1]
MTFDNETARAVVLKKRGEIAAQEVEKMDFQSFRDLEIQLKKDVQWLRIKAIEENIRFSGWIYEVETGRTKRVLTLTEHNVLAGQSFKYVDYLQIVESRLEDNRDCGGRYAEEWDPESAQMWAHCFYLLADIVSQAANIQHLSVASLEGHEITFWGHILPGHHGVTVFAPHAFRKLQTLHVALDNLDVPDYITRPVSFYRISSVMTSVPRLSNLRASGFMNFDMPSGKPSEGSYQRVQHLEIIETPAYFRTVGRMVLACKAL